MPTIRVVKNQNFTVMSNVHLRDLRLSNKARGLLSTMLSLPPDWDYTVRGLSKICKDGVNSIAAQLKELEEAGYLVRNRIRDKHGRIKDIEYCIYEVPQNREPNASSPKKKNKPKASKPTQTSTSSAVFETAPTEQLPRQAGIPTPKDDALSGVVTKSAPHHRNRDMENRENENPHMDFEAQQNTRYNKQLTEQNTDPQIDSIPSLPLPEAPKQKHSRRDRSEGKRTEQDQIMSQEEQESLRKLVRKNVGLEDFKVMFRRPDDLKLAYNLETILEDTVASSSPFIRVCGESKPAEVVRSRLLKVEYDHIETIVENMRKITTEIRNPYQYMLGALYKAPVTMEAQLQTMVQHDMMQYRQQQAGQNGVYSGSQGGW